MEKWWWRAEIELRAVEVNRSRTIPSLATVLGSYVILMYTSACKFCGSLARSS